MSSVFKKKKGGKATFLRNKKNAQEKYLAGGMAYGESAAGAGAWLKGENTSKSGRVA